MSDVKAKLAAIRAAVDRLREQVPTIEWDKAGTLRLLGELTDAVAELAGDSGPQAAARTGSGVVPDRKAVLARLAWQACRALPPGVTGEARDAEICRIMRAWNVSAAELVELGYERAEA